MTCSFTSEKSCLCHSHAWTWPEDITDELGDEFQVAPRSSSGLEPHRLLRPFSKPMQKEADSTKRSARELSSLHSSGGPRRTQMKFSLSRTVSCTHTPTTRSSRPRKHVQRHVWTDHNCPACRVFVGAPLCLARGSRNIRFFQRVQHTTRERLRCLHRPERAAHCTPPYALRVLLRAIRNL